MESEAYKKARYILDRQDEAYKRGPTGTWFDRWIPGWCTHLDVRCTHGDEIHGRRGRRRVCMTCGRGLPGDIPVICFFTGQPHKRYEEG